MKNKVIEVLDSEHGKKVINYWKSKGFDTSDLLGIRTKKDGSTFRYYGVIDGCFGGYSEKEAAEDNAEIIELPTESPKEEKGNIMKNKVIEVLDSEHGKKVIEYWKSIGVDTKGYVGDCTKESLSGSELRFYGVIDGCFSFYSEKEAAVKNAEIIELPEEKAEENRNIMKNKVIEVLNKEHGKKVIEYWKSIGVDVGNLNGNQTREDDSEFRFYGVIDGRFYCYSERQAEC